MTDKHETLISLTKLHIQQHYAMDASIFVEKESFDFFKSSHKEIAPPQAPVKPVEVVLPKKLPVPINPRKSEPITPLEPVKVTVQKTEIAPPPKERPILAIRDQKSALLQALSRPLTYQKAPLLADIGEKLSIQSEPIPEYTVNSNWKEIYPEIVIVSCVTHQFAEKISQAINERLQVRSVVLTASLESAVDLIAYASSKILRALILVYDDASFIAAKQWLAHFTDLEIYEKTLEPFTCKNSLYGIGIYELQLQENPTPEEKKILWNALKALLTPSVKSS